MPNSIRLALATETLLIVTSAASGGNTPFLPLGGSDAVQLGIVLGFAVAVSEMSKVVGNWHAGEK
jgi:hypothetical protein